jgi:uncharacterized repeat protein (TIGR03803 family)
MTQAKFYKAFRVALIAAVIACASSSRANAQVQYQFSILHAFGAPGDGEGAGGPLALDQKGNLYGVTGGGVYKGGTVFELTPGANGQWTETIIHSFPDGPADGVNPSGVIIDGAGNLYGAAGGGVNDSGLIFELSPGTDGQWTETILYNFCSLPNCADGTGSSRPTLGPAGSLYGVSGGGGADGGGTAFELTPGSNGWTYTLLYTFCSLPNCADGKDPKGSPVFDATGNLYGETWEGGMSDAGLVFALHPETGGQWKEIVLQDVHCGDDGDDLSGGVTLHAHELYATTQGGGGDGCNRAGCGVVFDLTRNPSVSNGPSEQVAHAFSNATQGISPYGPVEFDARGDLFGVTLSGGNLDFCGNGCGVVYGMKPQKNGKWAFQVLHAFIYSDGDTPDSGLTIDSKGNLYGTTAAGGPYEAGVVFELSPTQFALDTALN